MCSKILKSSNPKKNSRVHKLPILWFRGPSSEPTKYEVGFVNSKALLNADAKTEWNLFSWPAKSSAGAAVLYPKPQPFLSYFAYSSMQSTPIPPPDQCEWQRLTVSKCQQKKVTIFSLFFVLCIWLVVDFCVGFMNL